MHPVVSSLLRSKTGAILVAAQVALTLAITCNAIFVVQARLETARRPSGVFEPGVLQLQYAPMGEIEDLRGMQDRDLEALRAIPGVESACAVSSFPLSTAGTHMELSATGEPGTEAISGVYFADELFVDTLGLRIVDGRNFEAAEVHEFDQRRRMLGAEVVLVTSHLARRLFPGEPSIVGKTVYMATGRGTLPLRVVGVVEELMTSQAPVSPVASDSFVLPNRYLGDTAHYAVRAEPSQLARVQRDAEEALSQLRDDRVLINNHSMAQIRERRYRHEHAGARMLVAVTAMLLLVTGSGIVGISSLWVNQRRRHIGVRRALGAKRRDIVKELVLENVLLTSAGVAAGVVLAIALNAWLVRHLQLEPLPAGHLGAGMAAAWLLGLVAVLGPAWRASSVPPAIATRSA